jgi:hypothetical protein
MSTATVYSQEAGTPNPKGYLSIGLPGVDAFVDGKGNYIYNSNAGYKIKGTYDVATKKALTAVYFDENNTIIDGKMTICSNTVVNNEGDIPYSNSSYKSEVKKVTKLYYDDINTVKNYLTICGSYGQVEQYAFLNGVMDGPYSFYYHVHGGNIDLIQTLKGEYKNNKKDGEWVEDYIWNAAETLHTWLDWINGSYEKITKTTYVDDVITAGPVSHNVE